MILLKLMISFSSMAFILKPSTILQKLVENSGSGVYQIEQEVQFPASNPSLQDSLVLKETWLIENENKMRLTVDGTKEFSDKIHWVFVYENGQKHFASASGRTHQAVGDDFIEKYFHFRKNDRLEASLVKMNLVPAGLFANKTYKLSKDPDVVSDPHIRLARVGGVICYGIGLPADVGMEPGPGLFIEQDQFTIRKVRLPSKVEVTAENYSNFARGLNFPRHRSVRWADKQITIQTLHVHPKSEKSISQSLEVSTAMDIPELGQSKNLVEEFYKRFR